MKVSAKLKNILKTIFIIGFKSILGIGAVLILVVGVVVSVVIHKNYSELGDVEALVSSYAPSIPTTIYDRNNTLIESLSREKREIIGLDEISPNVKKAFISIEDKIFYEHHGINVKRNIGSLLANVKSGRAVQGASTISQQLAKNAFLTNEKKLSRKIKEALITFEIERIYTKDEILEKYLNEIYFGSGAYGIKNAAWEFFRKKPIDLNIAEAALLAGVPNRPERYNPRRNLENALQRSQVIIRSMAKDGVITQEEADEALNYNFVIDEDDIDKTKFDLAKTTFIYDREKRVESSAPDYTDLIYTFLRNYRDSDGERVFSEEMIYNGGLKIYTSLDLEFQKAAKDVIAASKILKNRPDLEIGMATIDVNTGEIVSVIGGRDYKPGYFNRASMAKRQLGSSSKPYLYFSAITHGYGINTIMEDSPVRYGSWEPKNYGGTYRGQVTLIEALDRSINTISVKLLSKIGIDTLKETVSGFGVDFKLPNNLTASLGSYEGTPIEVAQSYALFANGGYSVAPILVKRIEDDRGNVLYSSEINKEKKFDGVDVSLLTYMLQSSVRRGTSSGARVRDLKGNAIDQGGKTGTTNENRTVWYAGITPRYSTAVYLGYDNNSPIKGNMTGGSGPAPIWSEYYTALIKRGLYKPEKFTFIENNIRNGSLIEQSLNPKYGLIPNEGGNTFLMRAGQIALETESKFANGINGLTTNNYTKEVNQGKRQSTSFIDDLLGSSSENE